MLDETKIKINKALIAINLFMMFSCVIAFYIWMDISLIILGGITLMNAYYLGTMREITELKEMMRK